MKLAVIPARGGSKRIPRKNIRLFSGKPMIEWSITAARESLCFDEIIVSTDDEEIAEVSRTCGAKVPFVRPAKLADDQTGTIPVIRHSIEWFREQGQDPSVVCCVYATAPFIRPADIRRGLKILEEKDATYAFATTRFAFPIQRAIRVRSSGNMEMFFPDQFNSRSQDLEEAFHDAGQFYWGRAHAWLSEEVFFSPESAAVMLPRYRVQDIDTEEDWKRAELMSEVLRSRS